MKKRIIDLLAKIGVSALVIVFFVMALTGCGKKGDIEPEASKLGNKYIDLVTIYKDDNSDTEVLYDKNTKVMYFAKWDYYRFGITPIYNSDGTVKLYDEE